MISSLPLMIRMLRSLLLIAFLFAVAALSPQSAWASCGDWLANHEPVESAQSVDSIGASVVEIVVIDTEVPERPFKPQGCQGPLCKQSPLGSMPDPSSPVSERNHYETACLSDTDLGMGLFNWDVIESARLLPCRGIAFRIDRPPQA